MPIAPLGEMSYMAPAFQLEHAHLPSLASGENAFKTYMAQALQSQSEGTLPPGESRVGAPLQEGEGFATQLQREGVAQNESVPRAVPSILVAKSPSTQHPQEAEKAAAATDTANDSLLSRLSVDFSPLNIAAKLNSLLFAVL